MQGYLRSYLCIHISGVPSAYISQAFPLHGYPSNHSPSTEPIYYRTQLASQEANHSKHVFGSTKSSPSSSTRRSSSPSYTAHKKKWSRTCIQPHLMTAKGRPQTPLLRAQQSDSCSLPQSCRYQTWKSSSSLCRYRFP